MLLLISTIFNLSLAIDTCNLYPVENKLFLDDEISVLQENHSILMQHSNEYYEDLYRNHRLKYYSTLSEIVKSDSLILIHKIGDNGRVRTLVFNYVLTQIRFIDYRNSDVLVCEKFINIDKETIFKKVSPMFGIESNILNPWIGVVADLKSRDYIVEIRLKHDVKSFIVSIPGLNRSYFVDDEIDVLLEGSEWYFIEKLMSD